jgi:2-keto-4-pentenoate hydratase/2-oxohepta-3-ene-1,7-dioic acid hydratase in catechol pathway
MRLCLFETLAAPGISKLGLVVPGGVVALDDLSPSGSGAGLNHVIAHFEEFRSEFKKLESSAPSVEIGDLRILPPLADPVKVLCSMLARNVDNRDAEELHLFLKSPGSALGDGGKVLLPDMEGAEYFTHSACLAVLVGSRCRSVPAADWRDVVFGYAGMVDITARTSAMSRWKGGKSTLGSSCDTFGPIGPWIVPRTDVDEAAGFDIRLSCGGTIRQVARLDRLDERIGKAVELASTVMSLMPGDVIAIDGTAEGQGPLQDGDHLELDISQVGRLSVDVCDPLHREWDRSVRVKPGSDSTDVTELLRSTSKPV